jgi:hypothetical protein
MLNRLLQCLLWMLLGLALYGCSSFAPVDPQTLPAIATTTTTVTTGLPPVSWGQMNGDGNGDGNAEASPWQHFPFPGKAPTTYRYLFEDGRHAVHSNSQSSASMLRRDLGLPAQALGTVRFSWKVPELLKNCDVGVSEVDDSPVRILLTFEGDRQKFSAKNALLSELAQLLLGEPLPYATLVYVWSNHHPLESVILSPRTDRVRSIVVESGGTHLNKWQDYERQIHADFEKAFGEAPGALLRVAIMTDSDNTQSKTAAWYGALSFKSTKATN